MSLNSKKIHYSMGEVAEMFDVNPSLLRYWESKFPILSPGKNTSGKRAFTVKDIENLKVIYHLVKEKGMTLEGAQKQLRENKSGIKRDMEIVEKLNSIRSMLMEIRQELADGEPSIDSDIDERATTQQVADKVVAPQEVEMAEVAELLQEPEELFELQTEEELEYEYQEPEGRSGADEQYEAEMFPQSVAHSQPAATQQQALFDSPMTNDPAEEYTPQPRVVEQSLF